MTLDLGKRNAMPMSGVEGRYPMDIRRHWTREEKRQSSFGNLGWHRTMFYLPDGNS